MDYTAKVPDTVMLSILSFVPALELPRCARVCKRWRRLVADPSLWVRVDLSDKKLKIETLAKVVERGVRYLKMEKANFFLNSVNRRPSPGENVFKPNFKSPLRVWDLTSAKMFGEHVAQVLRHTSELVELRMRHGDLNFHVGEAIARNPNLEILDLSYARIDDCGIAQILTNCKKLKELNLESTMLGRRQLHSVITNLPKSLVRLNVSYLSDHFRDKHVSKIVKRCPNLTHLDISVNERLTKKSVEIITEKLKHLVELNNEQDAEDMCDGDESSGSIDFDGNDGLTQYYMYKAYVDSDNEMSEFYEDMLRNLNKYSTDEDD